MKKSSIFRLSHLVLYAKGWYASTDNVWEDLKKILVLDDYTPFTNNDVYIIIANAFQEFECRQSELVEVMIGISPSECWKHGYFVKANYSWSNKTQDELPDYDMQTAFIYYVLSTLRYIDYTKWKVVTPKYRLHPKPMNIQTKTVIEIFNRKYAVN